MIEQWVTHNDERTCPACAALRGAWFRAGEGPIAPMHPRCRCRREPVRDLPTTPEERVVVGLRLDAGQRAWARSAQLTDSNRRSLSRAEERALERQRSQGAADPARPPPDT